MQRQHGYSLYTRTRTSREHLCQAREYRASGQGGTIRPACVCARSSESRRTRPCSACRHEPTPRSSNWQQRAKNATRSNFKLISYGWQGRDVLFWKSPHALVPYPTLSEPMTSNRICLGCCAKHSSKVRSLHLPDCIRRPSPVDIGRFLVPPH